MNRFFNLRRQRTQVSFSHAAERRGVCIAGLTKDERQLSDIGRQKNLLRLLGRDFERDGLGYGRRLLAFARKLVDRENLYALQ